jgi:nucleoside-diphosphate-sugar epimerase
VPNINFNIIDVRDVADLHIRAMTNPKASGERFIGMAGGSISFPQMAELLKKKLPEIAQKVPTKIMPDWIIRIGALFNAQAKAVSSILGVHRNVSNEKAKKVLGWTPIANNEEAIIATAESLAKFGLLK